MKKLLVATLTTVLLFTSGFAVNPNAPTTTKSISTVKRFVFEKSEWKKMRDSEKSNYVENYVESLQEKMAIDESVSHTKKDGLLREKGFESLLFVERVYNEEAEYTYVKALVFETEDGKIMVIPWTEKWKSRNVEYSEFKFYYNSENNWLKIYNDSFELLVDNER